MRTLAAACLVTMSALTAGQTIAGLPVCPASNPQCYRNDKPPPTLNPTSSPTCPAENYDEPAGFNKVRSSFCCRGSSEFDKYSKKGDTSNEPAAAQRFTPLEQFTSDLAGVAIMVATAAATMMNAIVPAPAPTPAATRRGGADSTPTPPRAAAADDSTAVDHRSCVGMASISATVVPSGQGDSQQERMQPSATHQAEQPWLMQCSATPQPIVPVDAPVWHRGTIRVDLECRDYVDDIFCCISRDETKRLPRPGDMAAKQVEVTADMRGICLDWIIACANGFKMEPATIFLAASVLDRFLANKAIRGERMQMVSMVSLIIAAKYEETYPPQIKDYIYISQNEFTRQDLLRYEHYILHALRYSLTVPTPYCFISRLLIALKDSGRPETREQQEVRHASLFIAECAMLKLSLYLEDKPSRLAAGSVFAARQMLGRYPVWPSEVAGVCQYDAHAVSETAAVLLAQAREVRDGGRLKATVTRYAEVARSAVSRRL